MADKDPSAATLDAAIEIAAAAPLTHADTTWAAQIPWYRIEELRAGLDALGIDWREVRRQNERARSQIRIPPS